jgi:predicted RNA-binding protein Jag
MGRSVEKSGKTVNDAIAAALDELNLSIDDVHVDVLNEGKAGLFGLLSGKPAQVRVSELEEDERIPQSVYTDEIVESGAIAADGDDNYEDTEFQYTEEDADAGESSGMYETGEAFPETGESGGAENDAGLDGGARYGARRGDGRGGGETRDSGEKDMGEDDADSGFDEEYTDDSAYDYDREITRAMNYLNEIFNGIHVTVTMNAESTDEGFLIEIESDDSGILIGHRGETLDALQYLVNLYMNKGRNTFIRVAIDIENYKKKREAALVRLAGQMADKVVRLRRNFTLDAMNSYEIRIIHSVLQNHPKVETYSVGEDPNRKVVVTLKNRGGYSSR